MANTIVFICAVSLLHLIGYVDAAVSFLFKSLFLFYGKLIMNSTRIYLIVRAILHAFFMHLFSCWL